MKKSIVLSAVISFTVVPNATAMLVKTSKQSTPKMFQQRHSCANKTTGQKKIKDLQFRRGFLLVDAIEIDDVKTADWLLKNYKILKGDDSLIEDAQSLNMIRLLEKHGCNIRKIDDGHGGNYLHNVIRDEGTNNTKVTKDSFIKYAIRRKVNPYAVDNSGENLWHKLLGRPFDFYLEGNHVLRRAKLLHSLNVDPHHKNCYGVSAIERVQSRMNNLEKEYASHSDRMSQRQQQEYITGLEICRKLLTIMSGEDFNKIKNGRE